MSESKQTPPTTKNHNFGRPVLVTELAWKTKPAKEYKGVFHVWGYQRLGGKDAPPSMRTVAIVELENGQILSKNPDAIKFLDK